MAYPGQLTFVECVFGIVIIPRKTEDELKNTFVQRRKVVYHISPSDTWRVDGFAEDTGPKNIFYPPKKVALPLKKTTDRSTELLVENCHSLGAGVVYRDHGFAGC